MALSPSQLVGVHREHFLRRKLTRSPMLNFTPGSARIDATTLFSNITPNIPASTGFGVTTAQGMVRGLLGERGEIKINNATSANVRKIKAIKTKADDAFHSTGQHSLYLGYPCIAIPDEKDKVTKFAPLFLIPIELSNTSNDITIRRKPEGGTLRSALQFDDVKFNSLLAAFIKLLDNIDLPKEPSYELSDKNFINTKNEILKSWRSLAQANEYPEVEQAPSKAELEQFIRGDREAQVFSCAIIGFADFAGAALLDDLTSIEKLLKEGAECSIPLQRLLERTPDFLENKAIHPNSDDDKWLVEKSDPYQEKAVWTQRVAPLMVMQGPPGTGKSQTIVNLVADAVAKKRSVLVVCQKKDATAVVQKRLKGVGLSELSNLVQDISANRSETIKFLKNISSDFSQSIFDAQDRQYTSANIEALEKKLDSVKDALRESLNDTARSYRHLKSKLNSLEFPRFDHNWNNALVQKLNAHANNDLNINRLALLVRRISVLSDKAREIDYPNNSWSSLPEKLDFKTLDNLKLLTERATVLSRRLKNGQLYFLNNLDNQWLASHEWFTDNSSKNFSQPFLYSTNEKFKNNTETNEFIFLLKYLEYFNSSINTAKEISKAHSDNYEYTDIEAALADIYNLREIDELLHEIRSDELFSLLNKHHRSEIRSWAKQVEAIVLHYWLQIILEKHEFGFSMLSRVDSMRYELSDFLVKKRKLDTKHICSLFNERIASTDSLNSNALLRLRGGAGVPKTTLRHLYTKGIKEIKKTLPVLLSAPETASSLLPLTANLYDLVVIDEASQMYVAEAIPMLFRAKSALIAGDIHQMPPSNQFSFADDGDAENDSDEIEDDGREPRLVASADGEYRLLVAADEALGANSPHKVTLNVHYRSARKELIDFSNHAFYEGKLIIPSGNAALPNFMNSAIVFEQMVGVFDKGLNEIEALRIVEWLDEIWSSQTAAINRPTVGVIVNNVKQRDLVNEIIQNKCLSDRRFADCYAEEQDRKTADGEDVSLFVRSVESVQGDERDIIIYGFTYSGSSRRFGPLVTPKFDGRKRLNVAVTRAKRGMIVLNSLDIEHISNEAEKETAERYFVYQYLRYAKAVSENNESTVHSILNQLNPERQRLALIEEETDSPFEDEVKAFIETLGYVVKPQVGESGFRVDLGIKLALQDLNFLCGIECDGARYHSGWTARTRDVWRQEILESKGWKILRVWSTTWFEKPAIARTQLEKDLNQLKTEFLAQAKPAVTPSAAAAGKPALTAASIKPLNEVQQGVYLSVLLENCTGDFYNISSNSKIAAQLQAIVTAESPVLEEVVFEKIARAWGLGRTGSAIKDRLKKLTPATMQRCYESDNLFLCVHDCDFENYAEIRGARDSHEGSQRNISELSTREIYAGVLLFKKRHQHASDEEIANLLCRHVGMKRVTETAKERVFTVMKANNSDEQL